MVKIPLPKTKELAIFLFGFLVGLPAPYWYAQERVRGFVRSVLNKLPYEPPPGENKEEALQEAVNAEKEENNDG